MLAAVELATAYIALVPSLKGASKKISDELGSVNTAPAGAEMGRKMGGSMASSIKSLVGPAIALMGAGMFAGFIADAAKASDATDKFKATMSFAGLDTSAITAAKDAAKAYADQTVYDLPTIQNMTAQLASNGVSDYIGLTQAAGNLNAVAGGSAETFKSVAMVMTQTAGAGKLTTENWNQLSDAIPGAAGPLMKSLQEAGAYTGNFRDAMAAGMISSDEFNASLMKLGNDPVAVEAAKSTKTFEGAIGSLQATINSGLMSALDAMKPAITGAISGLANGLGAIFSGFGAIVTLFKTGDFNGGIGKALGVEEDSPVIGAILGIRGGIVAMFAAYKAGDGDVTSSGFAGFMERVGNAAREVTGGFRAMFAAFKAGDGDVTSSGFAGFLENLGGQARKVFDAIGPVLGPLIPQLLSLWSSMSPIQTIFQAIQPMLPQLLGVFGQLASVVGGTLSSALTTLLPVFVQLQSVFVGVFSQVLATVLPVVVQLVTMLGQTFIQLIPIVVPIITQIATLAMTLVSQLAPILMQLISVVMPMVVTIFGAILKAIGPVIQIIAGLLIPIIQMLMPIVVVVFGVIANVITTVMQIIMGIIQVVTGIITGNWSMVWEGIQNIFSGIWNTIVAVLTGVFAIIWAVISSGLNAVFSFIGDVLGNIGQFFADTWNNITNGISDFVGGIGSFFAGIPGAIMGALSGAGTMLFGLGQNIVQGLFDGIKSLASTIGNFFLGLLPGWIVEPFKLALGIQSPSRLFRQFGRHIGEGLMLGTGDTKDDIGANMRDLVTVPDVPVFGASVASSSGSATIGRAPIYVQNPFTGEYLLAQVGSVASGVVSAADSNSQFMRRGR